MHSGQAIGAIENRRFPSTEAHGEIEVPPRRWQPVRGVGWLVVLDEDCKRAIGSFLHAVGGVPKLWRPKSFSTKSMSEAYIAMFQNTITGGSLPASN
jgi:hypothetical protein